MVPPIHNPEQLRTGGATSITRAWTSYGLPPYGDNDITKITDMVPLQPKSLQHHGK